MTVRKNVTMSDETAKWYEVKSKQIGVTQSALMAIALNDYMKQDDAIRNMPTIIEEMKKLQEMKNALLK